MNAIAPGEEAWRVIYAVEQALIEHQTALKIAKQQWRVATHPRQQAKPATVAQANERFRIAFESSLRVYLKTILEIDEGQKP